jgi:MerR family transcriptional regulator, light-induced transcriptional regulator
MRDYSSVCAMSDRRSRQRDLSPAAPSRYFDGADRLGSASRRETLRRLGLAEIVSLRLHRGFPVVAESNRNWDLIANIISFAQMVLGSRSEEAALSFVKHLLERGSPPRTILLGILAPVARHLGKLRKSDHCDFVDVTLVLSRIRSPAEVLTEPESLPFPSSADTPHVLLTLAPGEPHSLVLAIVASLFRAEGWRGRCCRQRDHSKALREESFAMIGFSVNFPLRRKNLRLAVREVRQRSRIPSILVLVGGGLVNEDPELVRMVRADGTDINAPHTVLTARKLLVK